MTIKVQPEATTPHAPNGQTLRATLTPEQVCDLPLDELLARVNGSLDTTEINEPKFFGYTTVYASGRITIHIPTQASDLEREIAIRFLLTQHLGLPTHLFPDVLQVTVFDRNGEVQA